MCGEKRNSRYSKYDTRGMIEQILRAGRVSFGDGLQLENRGSHLRPGQWCKVGPVSSGTQLERCLLRRTCKMTEEVLEHAVPSRNGKARMGLRLGQGWVCWVGYEGPLSQITPCCFSLGMSLLFY